jgi:hypothetical protein
MIEPVAPPLLMHSRERVLASQSETNGDCPQPRLSRSSAIGTIRSGPRFR